MVTAISFHPSWPGVVGWVRRHFGSLQAIVAHGPLAVGETVPGAPLDILAVVSAPLTPADESALARLVLPTVGGVPIHLDVIEAYRLGWLPPSAFQQSLLSGATLLWGDGAVLHVIPNWRPDQIDPREALDELAAADAALGDGWVALAALRAAGALLLARRRYEPRFDRRAAALPAVWPDAPALPPLHSRDGTAAFVGTAHRLVHDWLFTWEGSGLSGAAVERYLDLWRASQSAGPSHMVTA